MDFSGKTTIIENINNLMPNIFKVQKKFLTPINIIKKVRALDVWLPPEEWKPLLQKAIEKDITDYRENELILQDSLWIIKYIATKLEKNKPEDYEELNILSDLLNQYPEMDSFYVTTTIEERVKRFKIRQTLGKSITGSDKLLLDIEKFKRIEKHYKNIIFKRFPRTKIIDTTFVTIDQTTKKIMKDEVFLN